MLKIEEIKNKRKWESFLRKKEIEFFPFFQSWNFGEVFKKQGFEIFRFGFYDLSQMDTLVGIAQVFDIPAKRGHFLHVRHGPVFLEFKDRYFDFFLSAVKSLAKKRQASFIRISPLIKKEGFSEKFFKERGFCEAPIPNMDAEICWILEIDKTIDQLLKEMRKTHRYLIRKAQNMDIKIIRTTKISEIHIFLRLYRNLSSRKHFTPHRGIAEEFEIFGKDRQVLLFLAQYQKKIIAAALIIFLRDVAIYHHGASLEGYRDIPASYLLQWEAILEAKKRGKKFYNFWGIAPQGVKNHPWQGLTLFKTGFGGKRIEFNHACDLPLSPWYLKTYLIEKTSTILKGY